MNKVNLTQPSTYPIWIKQAIKFSLVGILNTGLDIVVYFILTHLFVFFVEQKVFAKGISYSAGIINSFIWNKQWTFKSNTSVLSTLIPFVFTNLLGLGLNTLTMFLTLNIFHFHEYLALGSATVITLTWNFMISKWVVFKR